MKISNLEIETVRKKIKNIHLGVYPPNGKIRVAVPEETNEEQIRLLVISKMPWIKRQQKKFNQYQRQSKREYLTGESHYFFGKRYILNVIEDKNIKPQIRIKNKERIDMYINKNHYSKKERLFDRFYRTELKKIIDLFREKWEGILGVKANELKIKRMKTKWGSCNSENKRIWINLELSKKPLDCVEYVLVHEMIHLLERTHTEKFREILNKNLPKWNHSKDKLNSPLVPAYP